MAIAEAPGKLVVSGAYAVLEGAPAVVAAVNRRVRADSSRRSEFTTPEFECAEPDVPMPWFDASPLRRGGRKLGLGSSAAILAATLGVMEIERENDVTPERLRERVFPRALAAHRRAQGGGSGIDVAASIYGGVLLAKLSADGALELCPVSLPPGLELVALVSGRAASTPELIARVKAYGERAPARYRATMADLEAAACAARRSIETADAAGLVQALDAQGAGLSLLGELAEAPIVCDAVRELRRLAQRENGCVLPAGAGGGDIVLFAGTKRMSEAFEGLARDLGHERIDLSFAAPGLQRVNEIKP